MTQKTRSAGLPTQNHLEMTVEEFHQDPPTDEGWHPLVLVTDRGDVHGRYYPAGRSRRAAVFVGGAGGGFDTPVKGSLYPSLCAELRQDGVACLRIQYRHPGVLEESILDVLAGAAFLESEGAAAMALIGHSFGGAVVIQAAEYAPLVKTILPLSTQSFGTEAAAALGGRCSIFLFHGTDDEVLAPSCSEHVYRIASEPKKLVLFPGCRHGLDEAAAVLPRMMRDWINLELRDAAPTARVPGP